MRADTSGKTWGELIASHRYWSWLIAALVPVVVRLALLPIAPPPEPDVLDEFAYLLGAETFVQGRLTNPPHPMWVHLEAFHVNPIPTYASKYPPAQSLFLAAGKLVFGHPWAGVLVGFGFMCGAMYWALGQWGPRWAAFLMSILGGLHLGLGYAGAAVSSHWLSTYWGGAVACGGAALVTGALPGIVRRASRMTYLVGAVGVLILLNSRPFEGSVLILVSAAAVLVWRWRMHRSIKEEELVRPGAVLPALVLLVCGGAWMAYYNFRVTGDPMLFPYIVNQRMYAKASAFWLAEELPDVTYRHEEIRKVYAEWDLMTYRSARSDPWILLTQFRRRVIPFLFSVFWVPGLAVLLVMRPNYKFRVALAALMGFALLALLPMKVILTHYVSPAIPLLLIVIMQGFRLLRVATRRRGVVSQLCYRGWVTVCVMVAFGSAVGWGLFGAGPTDFAEARSKVIARLEGKGARHLVIVRREKNADAHTDWIVNAADIDGGRIVWARDMGPDRNLEILRYYRDRQKWLLEPDQRPLRLVPYTE